jgi:hypothetical protein
MEGTSQAAPCAVVLARPSADLYARLDGLRVYIATARAVEQDERLTLDWVAAELAGLCADVPAWCPGCAGRGAGMVCRRCGAPIQAALRRGLAGSAVGGRR